MFWLLLLLALNLYFVALCCLAAFIVLQELLAGMKVQMSLVISLKVKRVTSWWIWCEMLFLGQLPMDLTLTLGDAETDELLLFGTYLWRTDSIISSSLCIPQWVQASQFAAHQNELFWYREGTLLQPWACTTHLHLCAHWSPLHCLVQRLAQSLHCHLSRWPNLYPSSLHRLPLELGLPLCGIFVVVCNQTFISVSSLVQSKLIILADFSTVSGGSSGTLSMLLALMMHNTNPSLDQECAVMMN